MEKDKHYGTITTNSAVLTEERYRYLADYLADMKDAQYITRKSYDWKDVIRVYEEEHGTKALIEWLEDELSKAGARLLEGEGR